MVRSSSSSLISRRRALSVVGASGAGFLLSYCRTVPMVQSARVSTHQPRLPWSTVFKGERQFKLLCEKAGQKNWAAKSIGDRTNEFGKAICGTPYVNHTLELDNRIESPSVNFLGKDCWTFYETSLAMARMVKNTSDLWSRELLLHYVELERYRDGYCDGTYVSRMHHLEEVFYNNEKRGLGKNMTPLLGGIPIRRQVKYMQTSTAVRNSRYLRNDPSMVPQMAKIEARISKIPVTYIPSARVPSIESKLRNGDVIAIVSNWHSAYTSHVGLAKRVGSICRFMHASSSRGKGRQCLVDVRLSQYLREKSSHVGITVFRPNEAPLVG
ncbi:MAG: hypothetical protein CMO61_14745 [Verrucomicrobiales bacterium]|nr:hypothetical protein [Verrucomicrobiales bacterium]